MTNEEIFSEILKTAFITSHYICKNYHDAQDIAQDVCIKYLLRMEDLDNPIKNPISWSKLVARNAAYEKLKKQSIILESNNLEHLSETNKSNTAFIEKTDLMKDLPDLEEKDVKLLLNKDDFSTYTKYIKYKGKTGAYAKAYELKYSAAASKVYRMKRNLKAEYLTRAGYIGGKDIIDFQTNNNIVKFVKSFAIKMQQNDLKSLRKYFLNYDQEKIPSMDIAEFMTFEIRVTNKKEYKMLYAYEDFHAKINFVFLDFILDKKNHIRIKDINFPVSVYESDTTMEEAEKILPKPINGIIPLTNEEAYELVTLRSKKE